MINSDCLNLFDSQSYETKLALNQIALTQKRTNFQYSLLDQPIFSLELNAVNQNFICFPYFLLCQQWVTRATQKLICFFRSSSAYFNHILALFCTKILETSETLIFFPVKDEFLSVFSSFYLRRFSKYKIIPSNYKDRKNYNFRMKGNKKKQVPTVKLVKQAEYIPKCIIPCPQGFRIVIGAKPNSKQSKIMEINDQYIGIAIAAPPKEGEANEQLVAFLASVCGVKKNTVYLDKGSKSRHKVAVVENKEMSLLEIYNKIKSDMQN